MKASRSFYAGMVVTAAVELLVQDYYGLEGWIVHLRGMWWPASITTPIAIVGLAVAFYMRWLDVSEAR
jgi:hypothetical protein